MQVELGLVLFFCGFLVVFYCSKNLVSLLLGLEFIGLALLLEVSCAVCCNSYILLLLVVSFGVAEAGVILSFVVLFIRFSGKSLVGVGTASKLS